MLKKKTLDATKKERKRIVSLRRFAFFFLGFKPFNSNVNDSSEFSEQTSCLHENKITNGKLYKINLRNPKKNEYQLSIINNGIG